MLTQLVIRTQLPMRQHHIIYLQELFQLYPKKDHSMLIMTRVQQDSSHQSKITVNLSAKSTWTTLLTLKHQECMQPTRPMKPLKMRRLKLLLKETRMLLRMSKRHPKKQPMPRIMLLKLMQTLQLFLKLNQSNHRNLNLMLIKLRLNRVYISQSQVSISTQKKMLLLLMLLGEIFWGTLLT